MLTQLKRSPFFLFFPFFLYYVYYIVKFKWPVLYGDEQRYVGFANNMLHGFFSPPPPDINLWSGPGYSIALIPFAVLNLPYIYYALLNAVFYYLAVVFLYKALIKITRPMLAKLSAILLALYHNVYYLLPAIYTEIFTMFLVSLFIYSLTIYYTLGKKNYLIITGIVIGFLALTKVIFGYVIVIAFFSCSLFFISGTGKKFRKASLTILLISMLVTLPYLLYTYNLVKKPFYWGNAGGMSLYWMSATSELEYGDWKPPNLTNSLNPNPFKTTEGDSMLKANHSAQITRILSYRGVAQDSLFKQAAIRNIKAHPKKFIRNYYYNVSRLLFDFPYSYSYQITQTIQNIIIGSVILWASVAAGIVSIINRRKIIYPVKFALLIFAIYFLLSGMLSAYARMFDVVVPILLFWMAYTFGQIPAIKLRFTEPD